jgi:hypothetical protein
VGVLPDEGAQLCTRGFLELLRKIALTYVVTANVVAVGTQGAVLPLSANLDMYIQGIYVIG